MAISTSSNSVLVLITFTVFVTLVTDESFVEVWSGPGCMNGEYDVYSKYFIHLPSLTQKVNGQTGRVNGSTQLNTNPYSRNIHYSFVYNGRTAALYNEGGCRGVADTRLNADARMCSGFEWRSILIYYVCMHGLARHLSK
ncbi:hypothetical protein MKX03_019896 [Papaver bracteatum]|nr:hypothetical protein MKX03_019896 [Papaver bracteatum]